MLVSPIHAWSADRPSRDNKASQWLYSYETPPIGNNPLGPVTDKSIPSPFSDSQISLATETLSYIHNYDAQDCTKLCHDKYTFRLMAFATSRSAHVMPAPTYHGYPDINQCTGTSPSSPFCVNTGINSQNGGTWENLGFTFFLYGQGYNKIFICSNGYAAFVFNAGASSCPYPPMSDPTHFAMFGAALDSKGDITGVPSAIIAPFMQPMNAGWQNARIYYTTQAPDFSPCPPSCGSPPAKFFGVTWSQVQDDNAQCNVHGCSDCWPCESTFSLTIDEFGNIWFWYTSTTLSPLGSLPRTDVVIGVDDAAGVLSTLADWNSVNTYWGLTMRDPNYPAPDPNHPIPTPNYYSWLNDLKLTFDDPNTADTLNPTSNPYYGHDLQTSPSSTKCDLTCQADGTITESLIVGAFCFVGTYICIAAEAADLAYKLLPFQASMPVATFGSHWMNCVGGGCLDQGNLELPAHQEDGLCNCATDASIYLTAVDWIVPYDTSTTHNLKIKWGVEMGSADGGTSFSDTSGTRGWAEINFAVDNGDFTISASPKSGSVAQGSSTTFNVNLNMINYAAAGTSVSLSANTPVCPNGNGLCVSFSPASVGLSPGGAGSSTMTVYAGASAPLGPNTVIITGTDPTTALTHSYQVSVTVALPDFSISANPSSINAYAGTPGTSTITLGSLNMFSGSVALSASPPSGFTATLNPTSVSLSSGSTTTSTLTVSLAGAPSAGTYTVTVTGSSGALSHQVNVQVSYPGDFTVTPTGSVYGIYPQAWWGSSGASVAAVNGFTGTISLTSTSSPGLSTYPSPSSLALTSSTTSASSGINFYASSGGSYTFYETGTSGSLTHSTATSTVIVYDFALSTNPTSFNDYPGSPYAVVISAASVQGWSGTVQLSISLPSGWTTSSFPSSLSFSSGMSSSNTFYITPASGTALGTYTIPITGIAYLNQYYSWSHTTNLSVTVISPPSGGGGGGGGPPKPTSPSSFATPSTIQAQLLLAAKADTRMNDYSGSTATIEQTHHNLKLIAGAGFNTCFPALF